MELSSKVMYALLALLELVRHQEQGFLQIEQIATAQQIPDRYLAQLFMELRRGGLVRSHRGAKGGYALARLPWEITLLEVMSCLEGTTTKSDLQTKPLTTDSFVIQEVWKEGTLAAFNVFGSYSLQDLHEKRDECKQLNYMYHI